MKKAGFTMVHDDLLATRGLCGDAKLLLSRIQRYGTIRPSQDDLARDLGTSRRQIQRWLDQLRKAGRLGGQVNLGKKLRNRYLALADGATNRRPIGGAANRRTTAARMSHHDGQSVAPIERDILEIHPRDTGTQGAPRGTTPPSVDQNGEDSRDEDATNRRPHIEIHSRARQDDARIGDRDAKHAPPSVGEEDACPVRF